MPIPKLFRSPFENVDLSLFGPTHWNTLRDLITRLLDTATDANGTVLTRDATSSNGAKWVEVAHVAPTGTGHTHVTGGVWDVPAPLVEADVTNLVADLAGKAALVHTHSLNTDVTGTLQAAQEPAHSGDVTNAAGSLALAIGAGKVTNAMLAGSITASKLVQTDLTLTPSQVPPTVVTLTDGASVALDAGPRASVYRLAAAGDRTIAAPTNATDGQKLVIQHFASGGANRTLALTTGATGAFRFGTDITSLTATTSGKTDYIGCVYNGTDSRWDVVAVTKGF